MKKILPLLLLLGAASFSFAQNAKKNPPPKGLPYDESVTRLRRSEPIAIPPADQSFGFQSAQPRTLSAFAPVKLNGPDVQITRDRKSGLPIAFVGKTPASGTANDARSNEVIALDYLASLQPDGIAQPATEFVVKSVQTDETGGTHVRLMQLYQGIPVYGAEVIAHRKRGSFDMLNGRYYPTPQLSAITPNISGAQAMDAAKQHFGIDKVKTNWTGQELSWIGGGAPLSASLQVYHHKRNTKDERLVWVVEGHFNLLKRAVYFVDALSGEVMHSFDHTCRIDGGRHEGHKGEAAHDTDLQSEAAPLVVGPVTGTGQDLLNVNRSFGAWQEGSTYYMGDASKPMFNGGQSTMPDDPVGAILTLDAFNTSPEVQQSFDYDLVKSNSTAFNNKTSVSAHWNSIKSYDYFKNTFNRNGIDNVGGNIISFINVSESNGTSMENAFWNGAAMWYGNGGSTFRPLARGLDIGGHEMTHGVIEKTANLEYQDESGAMNESFADIFGAMIDRDDWKIGEDVMQNGASPNNALRDLQDPHNGDVQGGSWWQPKFVSEQFTGSANNGGVHINSGIVNYAYYLFATNAAVGKDKAEQVFYRALDQYLVKSSQFVDLRIAVIQASNDLYGSSVATAAATAFTMVGILGDDPGGNYQGDLATNPGDDYILCVSDDFSTISLALANGQVLGDIYTDGVQSRPSISDNGSQFVFVNAEGHIIGVDMVYTPTEIIPTVNPPISDQPVWRNAAISKDGRYLAALTDFAEPRIYVIDLASPTQEQETFFITNPTYSEDGTVTGEVAYTDVLEFDYSGDYIVYDAYNELNSSQGFDLSYWDIGFLQFRENGSFVSGGDPFISKLFSGLPDNTSVANPAFAKNSPYVLAFDFYDEYSNEYDIYGVNIETGDYNVIKNNIGDFGWPQYNRLDNAIIYHAQPGTAYNIYRQGVNADKISGSGNASTLIQGYIWGVWYGDGNRNLQVGTGAVVSNLSELRVSPNPATDQVRLSFNAERTGAVQISVVNLLGSMVQTRQTDMQTGENNFDLNLQSLPAGTYIVRLLSGSDVAAIKVVKK